MAEIAPDQLAYVDRRNNVLKLSQGEFVAVANLEAVFAGAALVRQVFVYGNSERPYAAGRHGSHRRGASQASPATTPDSRQRCASRCARRHETAELQSYEVPADFLVETRAVQRRQRAVVRSRKAVAAKAQGALRRTARAAVRRTGRQPGPTSCARCEQAAADQPVVDTVDRAPPRRCWACSAAAPEPDAQFIDLGGDSLSALTFSNLLQDDLRSRGAGRGDHRPDERPAATRGLRRGRAWRPTSERPTFTSVHGAGRHRDPRRRADAGQVHRRARPWLKRRRCRRRTGEPQTVLLTGANGYLGRFLVTGMAATAVRDRRQADHHSAGQRRRSRPRAGWRRCSTAAIPRLLERFRELAADQLEVVRRRHRRAESRPGQATWQRLAHDVDLDRPPGGSGQPRLALRPAVRPQRRWHRRDDPAGDHDADQAGDLPVDRGGGDDGRSGRLRRRRRHP